MSPSINQSVNPSVDIPRITHNSNATPGHEVIEQLVHGYAFQDMKVILKLFDEKAIYQDVSGSCLLYTSPSPRDKRQSRMPSSA